MKPGRYIAQRFWWLFICITRGLAAFTALYSLLSLTATVLGDVYNQNAWWIDLSFMPGPLSALIQLFLTIALGLYAVHVPRRLISRIITAIPLLTGIYVALVNTIDVYTIASKGVIVLGFPLPFSFFVSLGFLSILTGILLGHTYLPNSPKPGKASVVSVMVVTVISFGILFPLGQMYCFGTTDYRIKVDAAVVFGAQVFRSGTPSATLQDRLDTAIQFYRDGYTSVLVMSGGIDVDGINEARAMRDYAIEHGVAGEDIVIDEYGLTTKETARNTVKSLQAAGITRVAAVSNFYHLARIKMLYLAEGMDIVTVPSVPIKETKYPLFNVVREIPGWWYYWFQNLVK